VRRRNEEGKNNQGACELQLQIPADCRLDLKSHNEKIREILSKATCYSKSKNKKMAKFYFCKKFIRTRFLQATNVVSIERPSTRDPNSGKKSIAKAKRKRILFRKKLRSESEANVKLFSAKRSEANSIRFRSFSQFCEKSENLIKNFAHKNCAKFFAYFSFAHFFTVFLKIGTNRISLMKK
jgi:hypothetical protein